MKITAKIKPAIKITAKIKELQMPLSGGFEEGYKQGYEEGEADGYEKGHTDGVADGIERGYKAGYEDGKLEGIQPQDFEITSSISNALQLKELLFANIPDNHFATAYLVKPAVQSDYIYNQIVKISLGNGNVAIRHRGGTLGIAYPESVYDAAVTIGDVYRVFDLGEV